MILKFFRNTILVFVISFVLFYILGKMYGELNLFFVFFGFIYAPLGGIILTLIESKFKLSKPKFFLISILVTVVAFFITMFWIFTLGT